MIGSKRGRRLGVLAAVAVGLVAAAAMGQRWLWPPRPPNILFVVVDSLRHDRLGVYGSQAGLTPFLDGLAKDAIVYDRAYSTSSWTMPTVASYFLGRYPSQHRVVRFYLKIPDRETTLAEVLSANGYATTGVTANASISKGGYNQGFDSYQMVGVQDFFHPKSDGALVSEAALERIDAVRAEQPHFVYLHYMDAHAPYRAHAWTAPRATALQRSDDELSAGVLTGSWEKNPRLAKQLWTFSPSEVERLEQLYDGEVRYEDQVLAELFQALRQRGFLDNAIVIITADHGEEFGEHGVYYHGVSLYEPAIRVPLLAQFPGHPPARIRRAAEVAGVATRLFDALGIAAPPRFLIPPLPLTPRPADQPAHAFSELVETRQIQIWLHQQAVMRDTAKLLVGSDGSEVVYDLSADWLERVPTNALDNDLAGALAEYRMRLRDEQVPAEPDSLDAATLERLRNLGYFPSQTPGP